MVADSKNEKHFMKMEINAKAFVLNLASKINCNFDTYSLAKFVDKTFREIYLEYVIYFANDSNVFNRLVESFGKL
ncbi:unnamed protein product, partial [Brachionus calyciflorus]